MTDQPRPGNQHGESGSTQPLWFGDDARPGPHYHAPTFQGGTTTVQEGNVPAQTWSEAPYQAPGSGAAFGATSASGPSYDPAGGTTSPLPAEPHRTVTPPAGAVNAQPAKPRRWVELTAVAALAAILASGGTYALTHSDDPASPTALTTSSQSDAAKVVQAAANAPDWTVTAAAVAPSVVAITVTSQSGSGQGSGVVLDKSGHIITNNHVVNGAGTGATITVTLNDRRTFPATIVGTDPSTDLAVIKLDNAPDDLTPVALGDSEGLKVGEQVMAVGNPLGLAGTVTTGIISALNRPVTTQAEEQQQQDQFGQQSAASDTVVTNAIQTSAAINPGNSGGALVDVDGRLIGINSSIAQLSSSGSGQSGNIGIGFAIPVNKAKVIADQLIANGVAQHPFLGVSTQDTTVKDGSASLAAASVTSVSDGTPAAKAGIKVGDAIVAVGGEPVDGSLSLVAQVRDRAVGDTVKVTVVRDGERKDISVTLAARPSGS